MKGTKRTRKDKKKIRCGSCFHFKTHFHFLSFYFVTDAKPPSTVLECSPDGHDITTLFFKYIANTSIL